MLRSPGRVQLALRAALIVGAAVVSSCAAQQPPECEAYLACYFPPDSVSPYEDDPERAELSQQRTRVYELYGSEGECWRNGEGDPLYATCQKACRAAITDECERATDDTRVSVCVEEVDGEMTFAPPGSAHLSFRCGEL